MKRSEAYNLIREYNLEEEVKIQFGDNYTRIPTYKLEQLLQDYLDDENEEIEENDNSTTETQEVNNPYEAACYAFVGILKDSGLLDEILATLK